MYLHEWVLDTVLYISFAVYGQIYWMCLVIVYVFICRNIFIQPNMAKLYCNHLSKLVTVQWALEGVRRSGVSTLEGMRLPSSLLHLIQPLPLLIGEWPL